MNAGPNTAGAETPVNGRKKTIGLGDRASRGKGFTMPTEIATLITIVGGSYRCRCNIHVHKMARIGKRNGVRTSDQVTIKAFVASLSGIIEVKPPLTDCWRLIVRQMI